MMPRTTQPAASASRAADTENLNTDVMRFMAILGLCLAAIFALVQSVPVRTTNEPREKPLPEAEQTEEAREQERLSQLREEMGRLSEQIRDTREQSRSATRALALTRERLRAAEDQASRMRRERDHRKSELQDLTRQLQQKRSELDDVRRTPHPKSDSPALMERRLAQEEEQPDRQQAPVETPPSGRQPAVGDEPVAPIPAPMPRAAKEGFTLRFASSGVLEHLVARSTVSLFGMVDKQAWRLSLPAGRPGFTPDAFPARYHEMTPETVPTAYVQALGLTPGVPEGGAVIWGVRLPPQTERAIADLARNLQGGDLEIGADGKVYLNREATEAPGRER